MTNPARAIEKHPIKTPDQLHQYVVLGKTVGRTISSSCPAKVQAGTAPPCRPPSTGVFSGAATRATPAWRIAPFHPAHSGAHDVLTPSHGSRSRGQTRPDAPRWPTSRSPLPAGRCRSPPMRPASRSARTAQRCPSLTDSRCPVSAGLPPLCTLTIGYPLRVRLTWGARASWTAMCRVHRTIPTVAVRHNARSLRCPSIPARLNEAHSPPSSPPRPRGRSDRDELSRTLSPWIGPAMGWCRSSHEAPRAARSPARVRSSIHLHRRRPP